MEEKCYIVVRSKNDELMHYGIKGMKWGVRRYQNSDGSLTPAGAKRQIKNEYKSAGASKGLRNRHARDQYLSSKLNNKTADTLDRIVGNNNGKKYTNRQRAKDYDTAIRDLSQLRDSQLTKTYEDSKQIAFNNGRISRLNDKKMTDRRAKKIEKLMTDNKIMASRYTQSAERYKQYSEITNALVERMSKDSSVTYTTRRRIHATGGDGGANVFTVSNTDYKVRANTKRRQNSKKYTDPKNKRKYANRNEETTVVYMT